MTVGTTLYFQVSPSSAETIETSIDKDNFSVPGMEVKVSPYHVFKLVKENHGSISAGIKN